MSALVYPAALSAAAVFAVATLATHRSAGEMPDAQGLSPRQLGTFLQATVRHPWWIAGMVLNVVGFGLHALALTTGELAVVQPLLVTTVLFALPLNHLLRREPLHAAELGWAVALVVGLAGFLATATGGVPTTTEPVDTPLAVAAAVIAVLAVGSLGLIARRSRGGVAAALLGAAAGIAFAVTATLIKACTVVLARGPLALLAGWQLYALIVAGGVGLLLSQLSFQAGPLSAGLPAITVVNPLAAVLLGVTVYDENLRHTPLATLAEIAFLGLLALSTVALTRLEQPAPDAPP